MGLPLPSIRKLFREHFPGDAPLPMPPEAREAFNASLKEQFEGDEWVELRDDSWFSYQKRERILRSISLEDPMSRYSYYSRDTYHVFYDDDEELAIRHSYGDLTAKVAGLGEIVAFIDECKRRFERRRALYERRLKVHKFKHAGLVAQLKEIAREEELAFMSESTQNRIKLWIRLSDRNDALEIHIPPKRFQELLPKLPAVIRGLKETYNSGLTFKTVRSGKLPWNQEWITAEAEDADESQE